MKNTKTLKTLNMAQIDELIKTLNHTQIKELREALKDVGNKNYLLRSLYYDYVNQSWICPDSI